MTENVQLGTIRLDLPDGPSTSSEWAQLSIETLAALAETVQDVTKELLKTIRYLLDDAGLGFEASCRRDQTGLIIRASILPSDARESTWKRTGGRGTMKERAKHLGKLFWHLRSGWDGEGEYLMTRTTADLQKMPELYMAIPSPPEPNFELEPGMTYADREVRSRLMYYEEPDGVKTTLYRYQFRTVARMLQMETKPGRLIDTHFTAFEESGREGTYYVDMAVGDIQRHPGWYDLPRGGILAEQMGTGKTLAVLSLIVATLSTPPTPPPDAIDISPVLSEQTLSTFPFPPYQRAREALDRPPTTSGIPSLVHMCANILSQTDASARKSGPIPPSAEKLLEQPLSYYVYPTIDPCTRRAKKQVQKREGRKVYLANTTLIVVPQILIEQWKLEIKKHLVPEALRMLEIGRGEVPSVETLMEHDVVLIDVLRFGQEETMHRLSKGLDRSEFTKARWKRIVLDEGHVAGTTTDAMRLAIALSIERRWIVSGTPTKHLQQGGELDDKKSLKGANAGQSQNLMWPKRDLEDAQRIGVMVGGFLAAQPFQSESNFNERITNLLRGKDGPRFGSVRRLKYIMDALMVKHAPTVIDIEASLPPSTITTEMLQFHPMQRVTYNVLAALIASNVYTSNFSDPDYFLHPRNLASFKQVIQNLHLACFWYSAYDMGAAECLARTRKQLESNATLTDAGKGALQEAVRHLEIALATPGWQEWMSNGVSIPYEAGTLPALVRDGWSDSMDTAPELIDAKSLQNLRQLNEPGKSYVAIGQAGWDARASKHAEVFAQLEKIEQKAHREEQRRLKELDELDMNHDMENGSVKAAAHRPTSTKTFVRQIKASGVRTPKSKLDERLDEAARNAAVAAQTIIRFDTPDRDPGPRPLPTLLVTKSRSSKLNFVVRSILESEPGDKYVIFGDIFELGHVSEALDLIDVKSCFAGTSVSAAKRIEALREIEKPEIKVILLDIKLGARGLNLVCANRMIFLAPVWNLDVQAQAIKRVHRIGQTKPTKVEILVTRGTFEEDIAERSSALRTENEEKIYSRAMIENPSFVYPEDDGTYTFPIRFVPPDEVQTSPTASSPDISPTTPVMSADKMAFPPVIVSPSSGRRGLYDDPPEQLVIIAKRPLNEDEVVVDVKPRPDPSLAVPKKKRARVAFA